MNFYRADPALTGSAAHPSARMRCSVISSRISTGWARSPAVISTNARDSPTGMCLNCISATASAATPKWIEYHPAYRELERAAFGEFGIHAMSVRKGIPGLAADLSGGGQARLHVSVQPGRVRAGLPDQCHLMAAPKLLLRNSATRC
jgi:hypothetical protein